MDGKKIADRARNRGDWIKTIKLQNNAAFRRVTDAHPSRGGMKSTNPIEFYAPEGVAERIRKEIQSWYPRDNVVILNKLKPDTRKPEPGGEPAEMDLWEIYLSYPKVAQLMTGIEKIADRVANAILAGPVEVKKPIDKEAFKTVGKRLEGMRQMFEPTDEHALFLAMCRDIAFHISRKNYQRVTALTKEIAKEFGVAEKGAEELM